MAQLQQLDDDDEDIYCKNIIDRCSARPNSLEDVCLAEFAANYSYTGEKSSLNTKDNDDAFDQNQSEDEIPENEGNMHQLNKISLKDGLGTMRKCRKEAIIRWHNFNIEKEPEKQYRSRLMLFTSWPKEEELQGNYLSYEDRWNQEFQTIKPVEDKFMHQEEGYPRCIQPFTSSWTSSSNMG